MNVYTPPGVFDSEIKGRFIEGSWRTRNTNDMTSLVPLRNMPRHDRRPKNFGEN